MLDERKTREIRQAALDDIHKYDDLRANAIEIVTACDKRLNLLGANVNAIPLLSAEGLMQAKNTTNGRSIKSCVLSVLNEAHEPMRAREVWELCRRMGAQTSSANPRRLTDTVLAALVSKGQAVKVAPGLYSAKQKAHAQT